MAVATQQTQEAAPAHPALSSKAREMMEQLNTDAAKSFVWVRTQMNSPAQRPWFTDSGGVSGAGQMASGRVAANQLKTAAIAGVGRNTTPIWSGSPALPARRTFRRSSSPTGRASC